MLSGNLDLILVPQIFPEKPQILSSLEISILVFRKFLLESFDLTFPGNLETIPLLQKEILFSFRRFCPGNPRY